MVVKLNASTKKKDSAAKLAGSGRTRTASLDLGTDSEGREAHHHETYMSAARSQAMAAEK